MNFHFPMNDDDFWGNGCDNEDDSGNNIDHRDGNDKEKKRSKSFKCTEVTINYREENLTMGNKKI